MVAGPKSDLSARLQETLRRGFQALSRGDVEKASRCCREVLHAQPNLAQGHFLVGLTALEAKDRKTAFSAFGSVTRLDKYHAAAWANLAKLFLGEGQVARADAALAEAIAAQPEAAIVCDLIGMVCSQMGDYSDAQTWFAKACEMQPDHPPYMLNHANNLVYQGHLQTARELFEKILRVQPDSPQAHWSLAGARKATGTAHIETMQALIIQAAHHPRAVAFYYYAIGKEYEDLSDWDRAFQAFSAGAKARRETVEYDEQAEIRMFDYLEQTFTAEWLGTGVAGHPSAAPIFVLGQPRTGTTLIDRIISSHSMVHSAGELQQFGLALRRLAEHRDPRRFSTELFAAAKTLDYRKIGQLYLDSSKKMQGDRRFFVDKLPQNYLLLPMILKALPNAKIVHLTRGPMDACFASFKQLFADAYLHSYEQREMARHHARYRRLMETWRQRFGDRFIDISYEETALNTETNVRRLIGFLGLPWEDDCLRFYAQRGAVSTASAVQVREPIHTRSIDRWRHYEKQLKPMQEELLRSGVPLS